MAIEDPIVTTFLNEVARPGAERIRRLAEQQIADAVAHYEIDVEPLLSEADDADELVDERQDVGVRTVGELRELMRAMKLITLAANLDGITGVQDLQAQSNTMSSDDVPQTMRKFTVRRSIFGD